MSTRSWRRCFWLRRLRLKKLGKRGSIDGSLKMLMGAWKTWKTWKWNDDGNYVQIARFDYQRLWKNREAKSQNFTLIEGNQARFLSQLPSGRATSVGGGGEAPPWRGRAAPRGRGDMFAEGGWIPRVPKDQKAWPEIFIWGPCFACLWCWLCH